MLSYGLVEFEVTVGGHLRQRNATESWRFQRSREEGAEPGVKTQSSIKVVEVVEARGVINFLN